MITRRFNYEKSFVSGAGFCAGPDPSPACGKKDTGTDSDSNVPTDALTLLNTVWDSYTDDEKFPGRRRRL